MSAEKVVVESSAQPASLSTEAVTTLLESQRDPGSTPSSGVGLLFRNVTVTAPGPSAVPVKSLPRAILNTFGPDQLEFVRSWLNGRGTGSPGQGSRPLLHRFSGLVRAGEMLFVLGRPGSGCSTFLRAAANRTNLTVSDGLFFGGMPSRAFAERHQRESVYLPEEDRHIASLTVAQTIRFSLRMSLPARVRNEAFVESLVENIAHMFGLAHVLGTPVGGPFSPGVSGGERKRVSIAEVLAAGSSVQCFDNSTRGLDSTTALDFVKALRLLTDIGQKTTLATLYQAGEDIYNTFDKVLVIDDGHEVFFGKTADARAYFEELGFEHLGGQTTAEFLAAVTDPQERRVRPGSKASSIRTAQDLARAFRESARYAQLELELDSFEREQSAIGKGVLKSSYNLWFPSQVWECLRREYHLVKNQRQVYYVKWITTIILCLGCGSLYWGISLSAKGALARGSILFFALILNGWLQFPELFDTHTNRPVIERQSRLYLYRSSAVAVARFLMDLPLIAFQHVLFILPFYFLTRLQIEASKFFFFYLTLFVSTISFSNLLRMFAYFVTTLDDTFRYGGFSCTVLLLFAGFLIPARDMKPYFGWIHHVNPMYYAYENLFVNEFKGLSLDCLQDRNIIPDLPDVTETTNFVCAIPGARPGEARVSGVDYAMAFGFSDGHRWRNIGIMLAIAVAYLVVGAIGSEWMRYAQRTRPTTAYVVRSKWLRRSGRSRATDLEKQPTPARSDRTSLASAPESKPRREPTLTWKDVTVRAGNRTILDHVSGFARPGELTAICGASGAGKTTLLRALGQSGIGGDVEGEILYGSTPPGLAYRKNIGFAQQMDLHVGTTTVREALEFSALLRQPKSFTKAEKLAYVDQLIDMLNLREVENFLLGDSDNGLGAELMRRVTIGVELAARPKILFADEPTSGLDAQGAVHIIQYLHALARQGHAILVTIHQPSASLFSRFDNLLALTAGRTAYFGSVESAVAYFERQGTSFPSDHNPAEFILNCIAVTGAAEDGETALGWAERWEKSPESERVAEEITAIHNGAGSIKPTDEEPTEYNASTFTQTRLLTERILKDQWRSPPYIYSKIWVHLISALLVGLTFYQLGSSPLDLQNRAFSVYFIVFLCNAIVNVILARFFFARLYWEFREGPSGTYSWVSLCSASVLAEIPAALFVTILYFFVWFYLSGLPSRSAGYAFLSLFTYEIFQVLLGLFMMALSPTLGFAGNVLVFIVCTCNWFNGIIVPYDQMQVFWRYWLYYLNPFTYFLGGMIVSMTAGVPVECSSRDISRFDPPTGQTCGQYAGQWASSARARVLNPDARNTTCEVCKWTSGDQYLADFRLKPENQWPYWAIFLLFTFSNLALVYFFTYTTKIKRWKLFYFF